MQCYVDTSALVKLVTPELHSDAMVDWFAEHHVVSSRILETELLRTARRCDDADECDARSRLVLSACYLQELSGDVMERASRIGPNTLRTLDAIHLATADLLRDAIDSIVTYDTRLGDAARDLGFTVVSPGVT